LVVQIIFIARNETKNAPFANYKKVGFHKYANKCYIRQIFLEYSVSVITYVALDKKKHWNEISHSCYH